LSYAPAKGMRKYFRSGGSSNRFAGFVTCEGKVRAADAKEVGVGNPAEETYRYPNKILLLYCNSRTGLRFVNHLNRARFYAT